MQQLTFVSPERFEWREVARPVISDSQQAIVKPLAVTRCDLDLYIATGLFPMEGPFAFGHETAGIVTDVGSGVTAFAPGDKVIVPFQINCGTCKMCLSSFSNACLSVPPFSAYGLAPSSGTDWGGGLSDAIKVPFAEAMLKKIPEHLSLTAAAALSDNAVDGFRTVEEALNQYPGADVLVVGGLAQSVGLFAVQAARALAARRVVYVDFNADRLAAAKRLGAITHKISFLPDTKAPEQFPIVVEAAGLPGALQFALHSTMPCGICTSVSAGTESDATIPLRAMYMKGITYNVSRVHARGTLDKALECHRCKKIDAGAIISKTFRFSEAAEAMTDTTIKPVFVR